MAGRCCERPKEGDILSFSYFLTRAMWAPVRTQAHNLHKSPSLPVLTSNALSPLTPPSQTAPPIISSWFSITILYNVITDYTPYITCVQVDLIHVPTSVGSFLDLVTTTRSVQSTALSTHAQLTGRS